MAEKTVDLPGSPDVNRSWRRIYSRKLSFLYSEEYILPNYLRSTTSSCHDVCKYGSKHEPQVKPTTVSPLKRVTRSFSGTLSFDNSPLKKKKKKKALTNSLLYPSLDSSKRKKTVSHTFKTIGVSRRRELEMVEHTKRVTALKLKSVAQTAAMALRRSVTVKRKRKTNGGSEAEEPEKEDVSLSATMSSKRCSRSFTTKEESNVPIVDEPCEDLAEEKTLYVIKMRTENETVQSDDQNQRCVMEPTDDTKSEKSQDEDECIVTEDDDKSSQEEEENMSHSENKNTPRQGKSKSLSVNDKSMRLRFKRGKFSDVGSQDTSPRKVKLKRDTTTTSGGRRRLKTKATNISNDKEPQQKARSFKVVLKHQETQKKRDSRVLLFNKVIKKTANKLVETRKSKVKALVGAFESIISLQEEEKLLSNSIALKSEYP